MGRLETELLGLQIVALENASIIGEVDGLIVDDTTMKVAGFLVDLGLFEARALPFEQAAAIGEDAVVVETGSAVRRITSEPRLENLARKEITISFARAITASGRSVGTIGDFVVDTETGDILGIEVLPTAEEGGGLSEATFVATSGVRRLGREVVVLLDDFDRHVMEQPVPLSPMTAAAPATTAPPAAEAVAVALGAGEGEDQLEDTVTDAPVPDLAAPSAADDEPAGDVAGHGEEAAPVAETGTSPEAPTGDEGGLETTAAPPAPASQVEAAEAAVAEGSAAPGAEDQPRHFLLGKRVMRRIEDPEGRMIAEAGDTVSYEMIQRAKASDQLLILSLNVE